MTTITVTLPEDVAVQIEAEQINQEQLDSFLVAAVKAWLKRRQVVKEMQRVVEERPWSEAFQNSAVDFVDQLIEENKALFEELARV
jgi:hypothetical protein